MLIGELAQRGGVSTRSLRYYEEQGLLDADRTSTGYRDYPESAVLRVHQIRGLLAAGFGTEAIRVILPCAVGPDPRIDMCPQVAAEMRRTLARIEGDLASLSRRRGTVRSLLEST